MTPSPVDVAGLEEEFMSMSTFTAETQCSLRWQRGVCWLQLLNRFDLCINPDIYGVKM